MFQNFVSNWKLQKVIPCENPPAKAQLIVSLDLCWHAIKHNLNFSKTFLKTLLKAICLSICLQTHPGCLCWFNRLYLVSIIPPSILKWIHVPVSKALCSPVLQKASGLAHYHQTPHPSAVMINPMCSHLCHCMPLCVWFMSPAEDWTKGHGETDTEEGRERSMTVQKTLNRETF